MGQDVPVFVSTLHTRNLPVRRTFEFRNRWTLGQLMGVSKAVSTNPPNKKQVGRIRELRIREFNKKATQIEFQFVFWCFFISPLCRS